jgi:O-antigen ligase
MKPTLPIYVGLLALFALLPLPRGGTFDWAWMLMCSLVYSLSAVTFYLYMIGKLELTPAFRKARPVLIFFLIWIAWIVLQMIPMPIGILEIIAPLSAEVYRLVDPDIAFASISVNLHASLEQVIKSIAYTLLFTLILLIINKPERLRQLTLWLVIIGVVQALIACIYLFAGEYLFYHGYGSATGTFANRNQLASFLVLNLSIGIGLLLAGMREEGSNTWRERIRNLASTLLSQKVRLRIYLVVMVIALVLTRSRMGNIAFFVSMTITGFLAVWLMRQSSRPVIILLTSLVIIDVLIISRWFGLEELQHRLTDLTTHTISLDVTRKHNLDRVQTTLYATDLHAAARLTGTGAGTFYSIFPRYQGGNQPLYFQHAHNDVMEFLTDTGWIGLLLLGSIVILSLKTSIQAMRKRRHPLMRGMAFAATMGILALTIHSTADFNLRIPANVALFMVILALAFISSSMRLKRR